MGRKKAGNEEGRENCSVLILLVNLWPGAHGWLLKATLMLWASEDSCPEGPWFGLVLVGVPASLLYPEPLSGEVRVMNCADQTVHACWAAPDLCYA